MTLIQGAARMPSRSLSGKRTTHDLIYNRLQKHVRTVSISEAMRRIQ